jgi:hypothetical protein
MGHIHRTRHIGSRDEDGVFICIAGFFPDPLAVGIGPIQGTLKRFEGINVMVNGATRKVKLEGVTVRSGIECNPADGRSMHAHILDDLGFATGDRACELELGAR